MRIGVILGAVAALIAVILLLIGYVYLVENTIGKRKKLKRFAPWFWIMPALILLLIFLIYPVLNTIFLSFQNASSTEFVGLANYKYIFTDEKMLTPLKNNFLWLVFFTGVTVTLGLVIAVLSDRVKYEAVAKTAIFLCRGNFSDGSKL